MTNKIAQLVVDNKDKPPAVQSVEMTIGAQVKYADDEVVLVKTTVAIPGGKPESSHVLVEIPKE